MHIRFPGECLIAQNAFFTGTGFEYFVDFLVVSLEEFDSGEIGVTAGAGVDSFRGSFSTFGGGGGGVGGGFWVDAEFRV